MYKVCLSSSCYEKWFWPTKHLASVSEKNENLTETYSAQNQRFGSTDTNRRKYLAICLKTLCSGKDSKDLSLMHCGSTYVLLHLNRGVYFLNSVEIIFSINSRGMYIFLKGVKESVILGLRSFTVKRYLAKHNFFFQCMKKLLEQFCTVLMTMLNWF